MFVGLIGAAVLAAQPLPPAQHQAMTARLDAARDRLVAEGLTLTLVRETSFRLDYGTLSTPEFALSPGDYVIIYECVAACRGSIEVYGPPPPGLRGGELLINYSVDDAVPNARVIRAMRAGGHGISSRSEAGDTAPVTVRIYSAAER